MYINEHMKNNELDSNVVKLSETHRYQFVCI